MTFRLSRRQLLRGASLGAGLALFEAGRKGLDLVELHDTWAAAGQPNDAFLAQQARHLDGLELGASFAPEQWPLDRRGQREALGALGLVVRDLDIRRLRLGIRWRRAVDAGGRVDLGAYRSLLDYCVANGVEVCLNVGPVRTFRWPEEYLPNAIIEGVSLPPVGGTLRPETPLAEAAYAYLEALLYALRNEYGAAIATVQVENEPFYPLGEHRWLMSPAYLRGAIDRVDAAFPEASILVTSAGRLNLASVRDLFASLLGRDEHFQGRLISGFDYHFKTPLRDSFPVIRYFDQIAYAQPLAPSLDGHRRDAQAMGYRIEVTEGQAEPYGKFTSPGNLAKDFRFLLLRCLDKVLEPETPKLIRIWGVEELTKKMLRRELTAEHHQIIELIQTINGAAQNRDSQGSVWPKTTSPPSLSPSTERGTEGVRSRRFVLER